MKKIHLIRHAKSSWDDPGLADIDRPLSSRGIKACELMAEEVSNVGCGFDGVYCSPALRATSTIESLVQVLAHSSVHSDWVVDEALYTFDSQRLLSWCRALDDSVPEVTIVGHNPAMTDFCNHISDSNIDNIPTCGYVQLWVNVSRWHDLSTHSAQLAEFLYPKMYR